MTRRGYEVGSRPFARFALLIALATLTSACGSPSSLGLLPPNACRRGAGGDAVHSALAPALD